MGKEAAEKEFNEYFPEEVIEESRRVMFQHCVNALDATKGELESLHAAQCREALQLLEVKLGPSLQPFGLVSYEIDDHQYEDFQINDPFASAFSTSAQLVHEHLQSVLNPTSCEEIMLHMAEQTCTRIERAAFRKTYSLNGGMQFENDVRVLCQFFTGASEQALRHKFARLFEMASLLSLESMEEFRELYSDATSWRLTGEEIRKLTAARVDLRATETDFQGLMLPS